MSPHQKHYRAKMKRHGWMDESGKYVWPENTEDRQKMARALFGIELVSNVDYWLLLADDELDGTHSAPWANADKKLRPEEARRKDILKTLSAEQRQAVRDLLRYTVKGELYSFCIALDPTLGGSTISLPSPDDRPERLEIHSAEQDELHREQHQWLEDFSILFGKDERYEPEA
jgi:hypothetical protein